MEITLLIGLTPGLQEILGALVKLLMSQGALPTGTTAPVAMVAPDPTNAVAAADQINISAAGPHHFENNTIVPGAAVDARSIPWDGRIHSGTKSLKANGNWKLKRNVDTDLLLQVEGQLLAAAAAGAGAAANVIIEPIQILTPEQCAAQVSPVAAVGPINLSTQAPSAVAGPVSTQALPVTFATLMNQIAAAGAAGIDMAPVMVKFSLTPGDYMPLARAHPAVLTGISEELKSLQNGTA